MQMRKNEQRRQAAIKKQIKYLKEDLVRSDERIDDRDKQIHKMYRSFHELDDMFARVYPHLMGKPSIDEVKEEPSIIQSSFYMRMHNVQALPDFRDYVTSFNMDKYVREYRVLFHKITAHVQEQLKHSTGEMEYICTIRIGDGYKTLAYAYSESALNKVGFDKNHLSELITDSIYAFYEKQRAEELKRYGY